ncbi:vesicular transport protein [Vairimorpha ceranae]|uniref:Vesicular transport protein n=1 Tax=Vairimorpha ceranae TaxID=40302 RepID=A0A0F9WD59_9MICR|nr:vesicular transport protein [Vairimorpha ceranae]KAF5140014.1 hypothetical protein G9O61_00g017390 [Vairimorpha ceranae]KKO75371.1 vesicular transport protein [Vairimorpha ceranae]
MFFFKGSVDNDNEEESIDLLISRLEHSEYLEDKYDALEELEKLSAKNIIEVGTHGLQPIIFSTNELSDISCQFRILASIFTSEYSDEFIALLLKNQELIEILMNNRHKDSTGFFNLLLILTLNLDFCKTFVKIKDASHYSVNLIDKNNIDIIKRLIKIDNNFDKEIVFDSIFEKLINGVPNNSSFVNLILELLENNHFNQNYFVETDWYKMLTCGYFNILNILIDNTNNNIEYIKDNIYRYYSFDKALKDKNYEYIYKMIYKSRSYRKILSEIFYSETYEDIFTVNFEDNIEHNEEVNEFILLTYYFMHKKILKFQPTGFVYLIYSELLWDLKSIPKILISQSKYKCIVEQIYYSSHSVSRLLLLYVFRNIEFNLELSLIDFNLQTSIYHLIMADTNYVLEHLSFFKEKIYDQNENVLLKKICILLCCIHEIKINFNKAYIIENAKYIRKFLINLSLDSDFYLIDEALILIIDKINELINLYNNNLI